MMQRKMLSGGPNTDSPPFISVMSPQQHSAGLGSLPRTFGEQGGRSSPAMTYQGSHAQQALALHQKQQASSVQMRAQTLSMQDFLGPQQHQQQQHQHHLQQQQYFQQQRYNQNQQNLFIGGSPGQGQHAEVMQCFVNLTAFKSLFSYTTCCCSPYCCIFDPRFFVSSLVSGALRQEKCTMLLTS